MEKEETNKDGLNLDKPDNVGSDDLKIENNALKQLLSENKETMDALKNELTQVKTTNAKLLNQLNIAKEKPSVETLLNGFNKYLKIFNHFSPSIGKAARCWRAALWILLNCFYSISTGTPLISTPASAEMIIYFLPFSFLVLIR